MTELQSSFWIITKIMSINKRHIETVLSFHKKGEKGEPGVTIAADGSILSAPRGPQGPKGIKVQEKWPLLMLTTVVSESTMMHPTTHASSWLSFSCSGPSPESLHHRHSDDKESSSSCTARYQHVMCALCMSVKDKFYNGVQLFGDLNGDQIWGFVNMGRTPQLF